VAERPRPPRGLLVAPTPPERNGRDEAVQSSFSASDFTFTRLSVLSKASGTLGLIGAKYSARSFDESLVGGKGAEANAIKPSCRAAPRSKGRSGGVGGWAIFGRGEDSATATLSVCGSGAAGSATGCGARRGASEGLSGAGAGAVNIENSEVVGAASATIVASA